MTVLPALHQRLTACLAILAVLLLFVAPVVSKSLIEQQRVSQPAPAMMEMDHHQMMEHAMPGMMHHDADDGELACGYCDLLVHVPLMIWVFIPFIWLMLLHSRAPPLPWLAAPVVRTLAAIPRPRGPPCLLLN
ncbi:MULTISPECIES: DUF2946 domain-containing protein [Pantoea]|uniref:DUF2946 domain-containing protein n=1 Tax=Pantoea TaxID=53335 RepID=UPI00080F42EB|nr:MULTISPECIES: DUF2946 domain-containing protein [Pantoea]